MLGPFSVAERDFHKLPDGSDVVRHCSSSRYDVQVVVFHHQTTPIEDARLSDDVPSPRSPHSRNFKLGRSHSSVGWRHSPA